MLYHSLKILHILSATLLFCSAFYCIRLWIKLHNSQENDLIIDKIQMQTWSISIPLAIFQLATGFTMISLKHYDLNERWIVMSISGFIILIICWFSFLYTLLSSETNRRVRKQQGILLSISGITVLTMIFFMTNQIT